jgi:hypothetical protein
MDQRTRGTWAEAVWWLVQTLRSLAGSRWALPVWAKRTSRLQGDDVGGTAIKPAYKDCSGDVEVHMGLCRPMNFALNTM